MKILRVFMASVLIAAATGSAALATADDILMANDYNGGSAWIRDGASIGPIGGGTLGSTVSNVAYLSNGQMVLAFPNAYGGTVQVRNPDFSLAYQQVGFGTITALTVLHNNDIVVGTSNGTVWTRDSQLNPVAQVTGFGGTAIKAFAVQSNNNIAIASDYGNGSVWIANPTFTTFSASQSGFGTIQALAVQSNDNIVVGSQYIYNGVDYGAMWVRDPSLGWVSNFINFGGTIRDIAVQSNNDILIADDYGNGTLWIANPGLTSFDSMVNFGGQIRSIAVESNDNVVIGSDNATSTLWLVNTATKSVLAESANYGGTIEDIAIAPVPEPMTLSVLLFGGLVLIRKSRN